MKVFYSFDQRLKYAENNHKSDLVALTLGISDLKRSIVESYYNKEEVYRLCFNLQVDCCEAIFDPVTHKVGQKITAKNPKAVPEVQHLLNLYDWQIRTNRKNLSKQFELDRWMQALKRDKLDKSLTQYVSLRNLKLRTEALCAKVGRTNLKRRRWRSAHQQEPDTLEEYVNKVNALGRVSIWQDPELL